MATDKRRPTIIDIAKKADVSFKTVSRVLNDNPRVAAELRTRVLKAMADLDYQPNLAARSLAGRRGYAIALLVDRSEFFREDDANAYFAPYLVDLQAGALLACREAGYHFFVEPYDPASANFPNDLRAQLSKLALDGVVLAPPSSDRPALMGALEEWGIPYVRIAPGIHPDRAASVATREYDGTVQMAGHLLALGHRRLGMVCGPDDHIAAGIRRVAFQDAVKGKAELQLHPGDFTFAGGLAAGAALLGPPGRPSAVSTRLAWTFIETSRAPFVSPNTKSRAPRPSAPASAGTRPGSDSARQNETPPATIGHREPRFSMTRPATKH